MVKVTFLDYGAGNIRSLRNALIKVTPSRPLPAFAPAVQDCAGAHPHPCLHARHYDRTSQLGRGCSRVGAWRYLCLLMMPCGAPRAVRVCTVFRPRGWSTRALVCMSTGACMCVACMCARLLSAVSPDGRVGVCTRRWAAKYWTSKSRRTFPTHRFSSSRVRIHTYLRVMEGGRGAAIAKQWGDVVEGEQSLTDE
jgi:hypothetical protein